MTTRRPASELSYEEARDQLVEVVRTLEQGGTSLAESLALWERGEELAEDLPAGARGRPGPARRGHRRLRGRGRRVLTEPGHRTGPRARARLERGHERPDRRGRRRAADELGLARPTAVVDGAPERVVAARVGEDVPGLARRPSRRRPGSRPCRRCRWTSVCRSSRDSSIPTYFVPRVSTPEVPGGRGLRRVRRAGGPPARPAARRGRAPGADRRSGRPARRSAQSTVWTGRGGVVADQAADADEERRTATSTVAIIAPIRPLELRW